MNDTKRKVSLGRLSQLIGGDKLILIGAIVVVYAIFNYLNPNFLTLKNFE